MGSHASYLTLVNRTARRFSVLTLIDDRNDWDGVSHPDANFTNVSLGPNESRREREELKNGRETALFTSILTFDNGDVIDVRVDQREALSSPSRFDRMIGGRSAAKYRIGYFCEKDTLTLVVLDYRPPASWMKSLPNDRLISALTIPGTHDSCAFDTITEAQTQTLDLRGQLDAGIRFLDIRCRHMDDTTFTIHHGAIYLHLNFTYVLNTCLQFLHDHPEEFIIMSVKQEHTDGPDVKKTFQDTFDWYLDHQQYPGVDGTGCRGRWYLGTHVPKVGDVRGKIVLFRRYNNDRDCGIDASVYAGWQDKNTTFSMTNTQGVRLVVQDEYHFALDISGKLETVTRQVHAAAAGRAEDLYVNFLSYYTGLVPNPLYDAQYFLRRFTEETLLPQMAKNTRYGIIPIDDPTIVKSWYGGSVVVDALIGLNGLVG